MGKTCLNRLIGRCKNTNGKEECKRDYDTTHHPNNYDCKDYQEVSMITFEVKNEDLRKYSFQKGLSK
jgi:hypothetical protein